MPVVPHSSYIPPSFFGNAHLQTIYPSLMRRVEGVRYVRERIDTVDGDFLDLDFSRIGASRLAIISHGLEGNSERHYVRGMVRALNQAGWDALAWNFRGCSGEPNRLPRFYHSGDTADLDAVLDHVRRDGRYAYIVLVGFSLGGNVTLKYLGERGERAPVAGAVAISVPCDLRSGAIKMGLPANRLYMVRFLRALHEKIRLKMPAFPEALDDRDYHSIRTFREFDERYTAPQHGFLGAEDYWKRASSKPFLPEIRVPALLINALDDPFLAPECYPYAEARANPCFFLETPRVGGHVGFVSFENGSYWTERRAVAFLGACLNGGFAGCRC